jgi:AbrB family looped-hinge helix DNA binding protein
MIGKKGPAMPTTKISSKFQIVIPREVRQKLRLLSGQRLQVLEKGGVISLVPEVPLKSLKGAAKSLTSADVREKKDRI